MTFFFGFVSLDIRNVIFFLFFVNHKRFILLQMEEVFDCQVCHLEKGVIEAGKFVHSCGKVWCDGCDKKLRPRLCPDCHGVLRPRTPQGQPAPNRFIRSRIRASFRPISAS